MFENYALTEAQSSQSKNKKTVFSVRIDKEIIEKLPENRTI